MAQTEWVHRSNFIYISYQRRNYGLWTKNLWSSGKYSSRRIIDNLTHRYGFISNESDSSERHSAFDKTRNRVSKFAHSLRKIQQTKCDCARNICFNEVRAERILWVWTPGKLYRDRDGKFMNCPAYLPVDYACLFSRKQGHVGSGAMSTNAAAKVLDLQKYSIGCSYTISNRSHLQVRVSMKTCLYDYGRSICWICQVLRNYLRNISQYSAWNVSITYRVFMIHECWKTNL